MAPAFQKLILALVGRLDPLSVAGWIAVDAVPVLLRAVSAMSVEFQLMLWSVYALLLVSCVVHV